MKLLFLAAEATPFLQTGGLGDVVGTLSYYLSKKNSLKVILPYHLAIEKQKLSFQKKYLLTVHMGNCQHKCVVHEYAKQKNLSFYFIEYNDFFNRSPIYNDGYREYTDNPARFAFFSKAGLDFVLLQNWKPDVVHTHDWHTGIAAFYLKCWGGTFSSFFKETASVLTIHNHAHQGCASLDFAPYIGLQPQHINSNQFEDHQRLNILKGSIFYADQISTVSKKTKEEMLSPPGDFGLGAYCRNRKDDFQGILNGIDTKAWDPSTDSFLVKNYTINNLQGKTICKKALQKEFGLEIDAKIPVFAMVARFDQQKGWHLLKECIYNTLKWRIQYIFLGSGDPMLTNFFGNLPKYFPKQVGSYIGFDVAKSHRIESGSDFFLMPSLFEPCGLNQMYSLRYGSIPIVRNIGGLHDTVTQYNEKQGTGFIFDDPTPQALENIIGTALHYWYNKPRAIRNMRKIGMQEDNSWENRIDDYIRLYQQAKSRRLAWK